MKIKDRKDQSGIYENFKKKQIIVTVIALMLVAAGYLNFANQNRENNLIPTSSVADSEMMAGIGDAQLVNANEVSQNNDESRYKPGEYS